MTGWVWLLRAKWVVGSVYSEVLCTKHGGRPTPHPEILWLCDPCCWSLGWFGRLGLSIPRWKSDLDERRIILCKCCLCCICGAFLWLCGEDLIGKSEIFKSTRLWSEESSHLLVILVCWGIGWSAMSSASGLNIGEEGKYVEVSGVEIWVIIIGMIT